MGYRITRLPGVLDDKGASGWPFDNILTVDPINPNANYPTLEAAEAGASAGDAIFINPGSYTLTGALTITKKLYIFAIPGSVTITQTGNVTTIDVDTGAAGTILDGLIINNTGTSNGNSCVFSDQNFDMYRCKLNKTGAAVTGNGVWIDTNAITANLYDIEITVSGPTTGNGLSVDSGATVTLYGGKFDANTNDIRLNHASASVELNDPVLENDTLNIAAGSMTGAYLNGSGKVRIGEAAPATTLGVDGAIETTETIRAKGWDRTNAAGPALDIGYFAGQSTAYAMGWDATGAVYIPLRFRGSTVALDIAGTIALQVDASGNVGIGASPPATKLGVAGSIQAAGLVRGTAWIVSGESGPGAEIGVSSGVGYLFCYDRTAGAYMPAGVRGSTVALYIADTGIALQVDANRIITTPAQSSFSAYNSATDANVTGGSALYTVIFNSEIYDKNLDYANGSGIFTAPVTGRYLFTYRVRTTQIAATMTQGFFYLVTSNRTYRDETHPYNNATGGSYTWQSSVIADMDAGDTAKVQIQILGGTNVVDVSGASVPYTAFQGELQG